MASFEKRQGKKGMTWSVRFRQIVNGVEKNIRLSGFATRKEAERAWKEYTAPVSKKGQHKFSELMDEYLESRTDWAVATRNGMKRMRHRHLKRFEGMFMERITKADIARWQAELWASELTQRYLENLQSRLKGFTKWCERMYGIPDVMDGVKALKKKQAEVKREVWTAEEFGRFISAVDSELYAVFFSVLFFGGLRLGEAIALEVTDFERDGARYAVRVSKSRCKECLITPPKTPQSNRRILLPELMTEPLDRWLKGKEGIAFRGPRGGYLDQCYTEKKFRQYTESAGVKRIRVHDLRHSNATLLINAGVPVPAVSKHLGHASVTVTMSVYSHAYSNSEEGIARALDLNLGTELGTKI